MTKKRTSVYKGMFLQTPAIREPEKVSCFRRSMTVASPCLQELRSGSPVHFVQAPPEWAGRVDGADRTASGGVVSSSARSGTGFISLSLLAGGKFSRQQHNVPIAAEAECEAISKVAPRQRL